MISTALRSRLLAALIVLTFCATARGAPVDQGVSGLIQPLKQPTNNVCWATVATMMHGWKNKASFTISDAMNAAGSKYHAMFTKDQGMPGADKAAFLSTLGLHAEAPQNYTAEGWAALLKKHGPLWVTTDDRPDGQFAVHARVITAIKGDGTASGTNFTLIDPATGQVVTETVMGFVAKFEKVARDDLAVTKGQSIRPQVVHY